MAVEGHHRRSQSQREGVGARPLLRESNQQNVEAALDDWHRAPRLYRFKRRRLPDRERRRLHRRGAYYSSVLGRIK